MGQRQSHWLVLPLDPRLHRIGPNSLDGGSVDEWEIMWGMQINLLLDLSRYLGYSVYKKAGIDPAMVEKLAADTGVGYQC